MSSSVPFSGRLYTKAQFAQMIGVSPQTLTRWHKQKKIVAYQGYSRKMYYSGEHYINYLKTLGLSEQHIAKIVRSLENQKN